MSDLPVLSDETLKAFATTQVAQTVMPVRTGRFIVPIPHLNDGDGPLELPNAKELESIIKSGSLGSRIMSATLEGFPQIVPVDGTEIVLINNITPRQARALQVTYDDIVAEKNGQMDRQGLMEFFGAATGIAYDPVSKTIQYIPDNIGIRGDLYNMSMQVFKDRHNPYGTETDLRTVADDKIPAGHYQKSRSPVKAFTISGGFIRKAESGTEQTFPDTAMVAIGSDGLVSAIHCNDITVCYETPEGKSLIDKAEKIQLPTYPVGQLLLAQRDAPARNGVRGLVQ